MGKIVTTNILTKFVSRQTALMKSVMIDIQTLVGGAPDANFTIQIFVNFPMMLRPRMMTKG